MNNLADILTLKRILIHSDASSKKRVLEQMSELCAAPENVESFYQFLLNRERLGSTALGEGVALPHCRIPFLTKPTAGFIRLDNGIDFDAPDNQPVIFVFGLFVPEEATEAHLDILAQLAQLFSQVTLREKLKQAHNAQEIYFLLTQSSS